MKIFWIFAFPLILFSFSPEEQLLEMNLDEKIGQLFMAPVSSDRGEDHFADWTHLLKNCHVGNAIAEKSDSHSQINFLNRLQGEGKIPLLVSMDAEWGLGMRLSDAISFPRNMTLGAIQNTDLLIELGREIGHQLKTVGVHFNLAPVADVNNNPRNPVIHTRSFGEDPERVARFASAYAQGLKEAGILACAKHFPGHGDTKVDSHFDLPVIDVDRARLENLELVPFKRLIADGIDAVMLAHLYIPAIDPTYPTSLSPCCVALLRNELHFQGIIISDALNMKALADRYSPEEIALLARKAGCDLLLYGSHRQPEVDEILRDTLPRAFQALKKAYLTRELSLEELDQSVLRILNAKEKINPAEPDSGRALGLKKELYQKAVTLIGEVPFPIHEEASYLSFGEGDLLKERFRESDSGRYVVVAIHQKEALTPEVLTLLSSLGKRAIVSLFTTPYLLNKLPPVGAVLVAYENDPEAQEGVWQILSGNAQPTGCLPIPSVIQKLSFGRD